jgi:hypothetical protein
VKDAVQFSPERGVVSVEGSRMLRASRLSCIFGRREERLDHLVAEHDQGCQGLEAGWDGFIPACALDAPHELLAAKLLQIVGRSAV